MSEILRFNFVFQDKSSNLQVAAERNTGKLITRCYGFIGQEDSIPDYRWDFIMDEGDYDKLMMIIEDANAEKWEAAYFNRSEEDAPEWSLEIHVLGKHTISEGYNKFPKEFESFKQDMIDFLRMKRRQLHPGERDFRFLTVVSQDGQDAPVVMFDNMEKTFTAYGLFDSYQQDGSYFMKEGDWDRVCAIMAKHSVYDRFNGLPERSVPESDIQCSISVGYKPGQITQRYLGYRPDWWNAFATELFDAVKAMCAEGRKSADQNIGAI